MAIDDPKESLQRSVVIAKVRSTRPKGKRQKDIDDQYLLVNALTLGGVGLAVALD